MITSVSFLAVGWGLVISFYGQKETFDNRTQFYVKFRFSPSKLGRAGGGSCL